MKKPLAVDLYCDDIYVTILGVQLQPIMVYAGWPYGPQEPWPVTEGGTTDG